MEVRVVEAEALAAEEWAGVVVVDLVVDVPVEAAAWAVVVRAVAVREAEVIGPVAAAEACPAVAVARVAAVAAAANRVAAVAAANRVAAEWAAAVAVEAENPAAAVPVAAEAESPAGADIREYEKGATD